MPKMYGRLMKKLVKILAENQENIIKGTELP